MHHILHITHTLRVWDVHTLTFRPFLAQTVYIQASKHRHNIRTLNSCNCLPPILYIAPHVYYHTASSSLTSNIFFFFPYIFLGFFVYMYLCRPSEASTRYCVIPGGHPPQDWHSLPCAGEELDSNPGLLICSQVRYYWATSPPFEPPLLLTPNIQKDVHPYKYCIYAVRTVHPFHRTTYMDAEEHRVQETRWSSPYMCSYRESANISHCLNPTVLWCIHIYTQISTLPQISTIQYTLLAN
jgi:hypothetical protein